MFKAVIADDEPKVCQLIQRLVNWDELGIEVAGVADNGLDAVDMIYRHKPEIVITDIRMPGFDGLEMIKNVKDRGLTPKFIIISGYRHFEYAHNALKYNVEDYLLKPIKKCELNDVLRKICSDLSADKSRLNNENEIKSRLVNSRESLHRHFIEEIAANSENTPGTSIENVNREYQLSFQEGIYAAFFIKVDSIENTERDIEIDKILEKICEIVEKRLRDKCIEVVTGVAFSGVICIANYRDNCNDAVKKNTKLLFDEIKNYLDFFGSMSLTIGAGTYEMSYADMYKSVRSALNAAKCRIVLGFDRIIYGSNLKFKKACLQDFLNYEKERQLVNAIEILDLEAFRCWLMDLFSAFQNVPGIDPSIIFEACEKTMETIGEAMKRMGYVQEQEWAVRAAIMDRMSKVRSISELRDFTYETVAGYIESQLQQKRMRDNKPIRLAKQYISEHYMEQIRLDDIADLVYLNAAYFSSIFKKETGLNFSDYLINCRLDIAKELLKSTYLSIGEIAEKVGYADTKYFSKLFNRTIGVKPSEYRKLYS